MENQAVEAITALTKALDNGFGHWKWIEHDADLDSLRANQDFIELLSRKPVETETGAA